jgi:hypothetical protein
MSEPFLSTRVQLAQVWECRIRKRRSQAVAKQPGKRETNGRSANDDKPAPAKVVRKPKAAAQGRSTRSAKPADDKPARKRKLAETTGAAPPVLAVPAVTEDEIRLRAYQLWEASGRPEGDGVFFWFEAEQELRQKQWVIQAEQAANGRAPRGRQRKPPAKG